MRLSANFSFLMVSLFLAPFATTAKAATTIDIIYTGTATGSWEGNYSPFGPPVQGSGVSGSIGATTFEVTFTYNVPDGYVLLDTGGIINPPSYASASFVSPVYGFNVATNSFPLGSGSDVASAGTTSQSVAEAPGYHTSSGDISMTSSSPDIPGSIFSGFEIDSGVTGNGSAIFDYADLYFGGGMIDFTLDPETISVSVMTDSVPEPSTWAMLLVGFAGIGFMMHRRRAHLQSPRAAERPPSGGFCLCGSLFSRVPSLHYFAQTPLTQPGRESGMEVCWGS